MIVTTAHEVPGHIITGHIGIVRGAAVCSPTLVQMILSSFQLMGGGNIDPLARVNEAAYDEAHLEMERQAATKGADAIIGVQYNASISGLAHVHVQAYGTAVTLTPNDS